MIYDEIHGYALTAINPFLDDTSPKDHAFVDEFSCIGRDTFFCSCNSLMKVETSEIIFKNHEDFIADRGFYSPWAKIFSYLHPHMAYKGPPCGATWTHATVDQVWA